MSESRFEKLLRECEEHQGSCGTCEHYTECQEKYLSTKSSEDNNPSTLLWEIQNGKLSNGYTSKKCNFTINICEAPNNLINDSIEIAERLPEEFKKIVISGLKKYVASSDEDATIIPIKDDLYHFVFECSDCFAKNDFTDYCATNNTSFHCRYCGKKHTFDLTKFRNKGDSKNEK